MSAFVSNTLHQVYKNFLILTFYLPTCLRNTTTPIMHRAFRYIPQTTVLAAILLLLLSACEQEYIPKSSGDGPRYVVEGYIEAGQNPFPPYVILTRTFDFYGEIGPGQFDSSFVHGAEVWVTEDGGTPVLLPEICFNDLPVELRKEAAASFGFNADSLAINFCVYADILGQIQPKVGSTYYLEIRHDGQTLTSYTTIPPHVPIDSLVFLPPPGQPNDTLAQLKCYISDPPGVRNYYRYLISINQGPLTKAFSSATEDLFFDGLSFASTLPNPSSRDADDAPEEYGLYFVGDTITVKWMSMDEAHFNFWNTLEFSRANQGPFLSYTRVQSNIQGGLGIWGGYSVSYYTKVVAY